MGENGAIKNSYLILLPNSSQAGSDMLKNMVASFTACNQIKEAIKFNQNGLKTYRTATDYNPSDTTPAKE